MRYFSNRLKWLPVVLFSVGVVTPGIAKAATNSNAATVTLNATLSAFLTVTVASPNITWTAGTNPLVNGTQVTGTGSPLITTSWLLASTNSHIYLYGYFGSATAALTDTASDNIPSSAVFGAVTTSGGAVATPTTALTAFTQTAAAPATGIGTASASLLLDTYAVSLSNIINLTGITDTLKVAITTPALQPAGAYTGTITIQAQAD
ncbi:hypothetical protein [Granulicella sp. S156]|jgi:hypothetical protein|uniref:hypothetical protein n=1 Tax=Granulicella sp. S156 TaxID=1747224 RepID=UPI00131D82FA|nr:hypothetical protein [Granulicella sp. S156]